ncbi:hypothetical protein E2C01_050549 [Portunus trituberculatus]|uniref:Uncharacterized protein n=1 Tax=Portunus trituberculatus TaxID=210409 RepID=A0A5B7GGP9_PORTR|nr:hypothetical protein [Portunus trituberculatus]
MGDTEPSGSDLEYLPSDDAIAIPDIHSSQSVVKVWNSLSIDVVEANSLDRFKKGFTNFLDDHRPYIYCYFVQYNINICSGGTVQI